MVINVNDDNASLGRAAADQAAASLRTAIQERGGQVSQAARRKAVSEWFVKREQGRATALFDSGSSIGGPLLGFFWLTV
jgi:hypothetical protein